jgi:magnesium-transporting ATPase (P-type)
LGCESAIVYRSSPAQKADVVDFMKSRTNNAVTAAIGDGANDVNMIQQAHLGFGLMGKEGNQASAFADYAFPRFKDLRRALFWHGRPFGLRLNNFVIWCLFKSVTNAAQKYCMNFENGWSGHQAVDTTMMALYNVLCTIWFMLFWTLWDQDVSVSRNGGDKGCDESTLKYKMYERYAYTRDLLSKQKFIRLVIAYDIYGLIVGVITYYVYFFADGVINVDGQTMGTYAYGVFGTLVCVAIHHLQMGGNTKNWTPILAFFFCASVGLTLVTCQLTDMGKDSNVRGSIWSILFKSPPFLLMMLLVSVGMWLPIYFAKQIR